MFPLRIYTALKLLERLYLHSTGLFPLRIYTALKLVNYCLGHCIVCFPYKFTLLSNSSVCPSVKDKFVSPTNLHCSQTNTQSLDDELLFVSPTNLHCSQTDLPDVSFIDGLFPLRIYTALKPQTSNCPRKISAKYLCNIPSFFRKHFCFNIKYIDLHPL